MRVLLFDGVCGLCNAGIDFLVRIDRDQKLRYAPLQGDTAAALREEHPAIPKELESVVLVDDGVVYLKAKAVARVARYLPWPWKVAYALAVFPRWLTDPFYDLVARSRYRLFGKKDVCRIPEPHERALFLP